MGEKTLMRPILITASIIGIVQGLIWAFLSLVSVLYYNKALLHTQKILGANVSDTICFLYLDPDQKNKEAIKNVIGEDLVVSSKNFNIFMYFYLGLSAVWLASSGIVFWSNLRNKLKDYTIQLLILWIVSACCLTIVDTVLMGLIAYDYNTVSHAKLPEVAEAIEQPVITIVLTSMGIVMTLAARGYVVWLINVIFVVILAKYCHRLLTKDPRPETSIIDAFGNSLFLSTRPPWDPQNSLYDESNSNNFDFTNKGFRNDNNESIYPRSNSFHHLQADPRDPRLDQTRSRNRSDRQSAGRHEPRLQEPINPVNNNYSNSNINNFRNSPLNRFSFEPEFNQPPMEWRAPVIKTAKIGRQAGQRSPPLNIAPPFIPAPDYSPPHSPRVKGVLRPKSNYMYQ